MASRKFPSEVKDAVLSAFGSGCSARDLLAGIEQARQASECRRASGPCVCGMHVTKIDAWPTEPPWTYCRDALPTKTGRYEVAVLVGISTDGAGTPLGTREQAFWSTTSVDGSYRWSLPNVFAWRPEGELPPLRPKDRAYLIEQGVPGEWVEEEDR